MITPYATYTGTRRNLDALQVHGWRILVSPDTLSRHAWARPTWTDGSPAPYALDNGAWGAFQSEKPWDGARFVRALDAVGVGADFIVVPDVVADARATMLAALEWLPRLKLTTPARLLFAVQDGMEAHQVAPWLRRGCGIFVGGSTEWKLRTLPMWAELAHTHATYIHVGRVNSERRIRYCRDVGVHSFDGTACTRFAVNTPRLTRAVRHPQVSLWRR